MRRAMENSVARPRGSGTTTTTTSTNLSSSSLPPSLVSSLSSPVQLNLQVPAVSSNALTTNLDSVPSQNEVQLARNQMQSYLHSSDGSELGSLPLMTFPDDRGRLQRQVTVRQAFQMLETDRSFERLVTALLTDAATWRAVMSNSEVQNFLRVQTGATSSHVQVPVSGSFCDQHRPSGQEESSRTGSRTTNGFWRIIFEIAQLLVGKQMWKVIKTIMEELFPPAVTEGDSVELNDESKMETLQLAFILSVLISLVVGLLRIFVFA